ncbi:MAG: PhoX family phosphatase [Gammaproteobacteria bacterium]|nr:MAG: PhoX family phosphatase [Gammaproteobacteria bacterium]
MSHDHDEIPSNPTNNRKFVDILESRISRRTVLAGGLATATVSFFGGSSIALASGFSDDRNWRRRGNLINFTPVPVAEANGPYPVISADYEFDVLIPWGDPIEPDGPAFSYPPSATDQAKQIGIGHDGMHFFPMGDGKFHRGEANEHGMLVVNNEFGDNTHVLGKAAPESLEDVRVSQHAHGVTVVEIEKRRGKWRTVNSKNARRIHVNTPVMFSGPVAGHDLLKTPNGNIPLGTVNNCANGHTPWGTYLTCEENFNGYFGATNNTSTWIATPAQRRYGFSAGGFGYGWERFDRRFDLSDEDYKNEENRFGWVVEIDPMDARQKPVKRTALGRFKHEGVAITEGKGGRIVAYMGDDERFDYIYKFVSDDNWKAMRAQGKSPLDHGKLYVARFNDDGSGEWLELTIDNPALAAQFADQAEVLTFARMAADVLGATPMDRPEWTSVAPNGDVYCTLTNNSRRTLADAANPQAPNPHGHIIRWHDDDHHVGTTFTWDIFIVAADTHGTEDAFGSPDGLWADPDGRIFIQTDGGQPDGMNDQMLVADSRNGELRRLLSGVRGCEVTGITTTPDRRTLFVNLQHPGDGDPGLSNFPLPYDGVTIPRDATLVITRKDGGIIGS